ncbi:MAG: PqqD family protein [Acidimicrobiia bacterium]|nr:PqqD family protein [Acidimicrobiia bacterium]
MSQAIGPPRQHIIETEIGDEISLYDPATERVMVLNTTASDVWRLVDGQNTVDQIVSLLSLSYGVDPAAIEADVHSAVARLVDEGLLEGGGS